MRSVHPLDAIRVLVSLELHLSHRFSDRLPLILVCTDYHGPRRGQRFYGYGYDRYNDDWEEDDW